MTANLKTRRDGRFLRVAALVGVLGCMASCCLLCEVHAGAPAPLPKAPGVQSAGRAVHFPKYRSLGALYVQDADAERRIETFHHWIDGTTWESFGEARGDVPVPPRKRLWLTVGKDAWKDLSPLSRLRPEDLYPGLFIKKERDNFNPLWYNVLEQTERTYKRCLTHEESYLTTTGFFKHFWQETHRRF